jgi:hypothetical protein
VVESKLSRCSRLAVSRKISRPRQISRRGTAGSAIPSLNDRSDANAWKRRPSVAVDQGLAGTMRNGEPDAEKAKLEKSLAVRSLCGRSCSVFRAPFSQAVGPL